MNDKKTTTLSGVLMYPLEVGSCALILNRGRVLRTSRVVAIHRKKRDEIRFETMNTNYRLLLDPSPQTAEEMLCMAA